ncbi:hypothetical protein FKO01_54155 [Mesorhizobium sp. B2-3-3]|nr:hypothetical protein FKO01_54155 [Mesorhizobium sp. B2-3-3]
MHVLSTRRLYRSDTFKRHGHHFSIFRRQDVWPVAHATVRPSPVLMAVHLRSDSAEQKQD